MKIISILSSFLIIGFLCYLYISPKIQDQTKQVSSQQNEKQSKLIRHALKASKEALNKVETLTNTEVIIHEPKLESEQLVKTKEATAHLNQINRTLKELEILLKSQDNQLADRRQRFNYKGELIINEFSDEDYQYDEKELNEGFERRRVIEKLDSIIASQL